MATAKKIGRPAESVPQDVANVIVEWISQGKTLRDFCRQEGMPSFMSVYRWIEKDAEFALRFARAREVGFDVIAEECVAIAEDGHNDWVETKFGPQVNAEHIQRSRLRVDTRLKLLAKWNPKKYGEKVQQELSGEVSVKRVLTDV